MTSSNRPRDTFYQWFLNPLLIIKDQIKAINLSAGAGNVEEANSFAVLDVEKEKKEEDVENLGENLVKVKEGVDLEKRTLGEWLDYLEVALPKEIIDATEEMSLALKQKAERVQEFMKQQKNAMGRNRIPKSWMKD